MLKVGLAEAVEPDGTAELLGELLTQAVEKGRLGHAAGLELEQGMGAVAFPDLAHCRPQLLHRDAGDVLVGDEAVEQR